MREEAPPTTRRLVARAQVGDRGAANALLGRVRPRLVAWVTTRLGPRLRARVEADDIVQEILLQAYAAIPRYEARGKRAFYGWLFTIADRCIKGAADREGALKRDPRRERDLDSRIAASQTSPSSGAARNEERTLLLEALGELPERHRTVFRLRRLEHQSNEEVAGILGVTRNHASVLYLRAVQALREQIAAARERATDVSGGS